MTRNQYNGRVTKYTFSRQAIDCIVFWTKNPVPFIEYLPGLNSMGIPYYFQYTLTGYGRDMEAVMPEIWNRIQAFKALCKAGNGHVIWRYDPVLFTRKYTPEWHEQTFGEIAKELCEYTDKVVISFLDIYPQLTSLKMLCSPFRQTHIDLKAFASNIAGIARKYGLTIATCAEEMDLSAYGISRNQCIDKEYIEKITGKVLRIGKDKAQREACGCIESIDIGAYNTCGNGCAYCYANKDAGMITAKRHCYSPRSPILCDTLHEGEPCLEKRLKSNLFEPEPEQLSLFNMMEDK